MTQDKTGGPDLAAPEHVNRLAEDMRKHMPWGRGVPTLLALAVKLEAAEAERDAALNQLDSARHSVDVLERRVAEVLSESEAERDAALGLQQTDHEQFRCAECDCENGGNECTWFIPDRGGAA